MLTAENFYNLFSSHNLYLSHFMNKEKVKGENNKIVFYAHQTTAAQIELYDYF